MLISLGFLGGETGMIWTYENNYSISDYVVADGEYTVECLALLL